MHPRTVLRIALLTGVLAGCGDKSSSSSVSSSSAASSAAASTASAAPSAAKTETPASGDAGSIDALREKTKGVMDALKKGDAKAAADFCLGKHRDGLEKFIDKSLHEGGGRTKAFAAWNGTIGEIRVKGDLARVGVGEEAEGPRVVYLSFRKKDGTWSLDDLPVVDKSAWGTWGDVAH